eukprot:comp20577_c0_seq1/m.26491 comp20577_c0_seq1/g.26491  ORF comp20577_c0_seq1/g.26491 comp20577_c0_seq1/m.26491 type:complete len:208 (-) comp20577_c0_seq1:383-1006(-)
MAALTELLNAAYWLEQQGRPEKLEPETLESLLQLAVERKPSTTDGENDILSMCSEASESECSPVATVPVRDVSLSPMSPIRQGKSPTTKTLRAKSEKAGGKIRVRVSSISSSSSPKESSDKRRECHNIYEKQRRAQLKTSLEALKETVPTLADVDKPSTLDVLQHSLHLIEDLREQQEKLSARKKEEEERRQRLLGMLSQLKTEDAQ